MQGSEPRELRLEGGALWITVALLLAALAGAFLAGRLTAPAAEAPPRAGAGETPAATRPPADVDAQAGGFDTGGVAEPQRQVAAPEPPPAP